MAHSLLVMDLVWDSTVVWDTTVDWDITEDWDIQTTDTDGKWKEKNGINLIKDI